MNLIRLALRKPITILVLVAGLFFFGVNAVRNIKIDIFPQLDLPVIYISHPFGGYTPTQMEAFFGNVYVRSSFTSIPGLVSPAPFGGNVRTIVIKADPELLRAHNLTSDQLVQAIRINNQTSPSGNVRIGDYNYLTPTNTTIKTLKDF